MVQFLFDYGECDDEVRIGAMVFTNFFCDSGKLEWGMNAETEVRPERFNCLFRFRPRRLAATKD